MVSPTQSKLLHTSPYPSAGQLTPIIGRGTQSTVKSKAINIVSLLHSLWIFMFQKVYLNNLPVLFLLQFSHWWVTICNWSMAKLQFSAIFRSQHSSHGLSFGRTSLIKYIERALIYTYEESKTENIYRNNTLEK